MEITWYGTASLVLREEQTSIAFDPFCNFGKDSLASRDSLSEMKKIYSSARHVFITHGHFDHIYYIPYFYRNTRATIHCTDIVCRTLSKHRIPGKKLRRIAPGFCANAGPFTVQAWKSCHCRYDIPLILNKMQNRRFWQYPLHVLELLSINSHYPECGQILFYEVSAGNLRIQIMGSLNLAKDVEYPTGADVLILPLQGRSHIETYALQFVERLKPKSILLDHYDDAFPPFTDTVDSRKFVKIVQKRFGIPCRPLKWGETVILKPQSEGGKQNE